MDFHEKDKTFVRPSYFYGNSYTNNAVFLYWNKLQCGVSISDKTSYCKILCLKNWNLEAARFVFRIVWSLWNLTGTSAALPPSCLSHFKDLKFKSRKISFVQNIHSLLSFSKKCPEHGGDTAVFRAKIPPIWQLKMRFRLTLYITTISIS